MFCSFPALSVQRRAHAGLLAGDELAGDLLPAQGLVTSSEEYYPTVAINALMRTLRDPSMSSHHPQARTDPYSLLPVPPWTLRDPLHVLEEYYPTVAINALMRTLRDPSMSSHHPQARTDP